MFCIFAISGCNDVQPDKPAEVTFRDVYASLAEQQQSGGESAPEEKRRMTLSVSSMPLRQFLQHISEKEGLSIICDVELDSKPVSIDVVDTDVGEILSAVARRFGADITRQDNLYYIGNLKPEDRAFLVRKVRRLSADELRQVLASMASETGRVFASNDGLVVAADRVRVLQRVSAMLDDVERQPANTWVVQLYLISTTDKASRELGVDTTLALDVSATFANNRAKAVTDGAFKAILKAARSSTDFSVLAEPMLLMVDGGTSSIKDGEKIPIPRRTVSDSGTVTTTGYDYVDTGIIVQAILREMSSKTASCALSIDLTQVSGYVGDSPVTTGQTFTTTTVLESGGTYLVGAMSKKSATREKGGTFFDTYSKRSVNDGQVMIWLRCYRIDGAARKIGE